MPIALTLIANDQMRRGVQHVLQSLTDGCKYNEEL